MRIFNKAPIIIGIHIYRLSIGNECHNLRIKNYNNRCEVMFCNFRIRIIIKPQNVDTDEDLYFNGGKLP